MPPVGQVREPVAYVREQREDPSGTPFEIVLGGATPGDAARTRDLIGPLTEAGATWWDERRIQTGEALDRLTPGLRRIEQGPAVL
ncbi:hypothetical protein GT002_18390 [Streptomyces sp. SID4917]|nr:hypothetical protein [Streptomyces sp. SID4917]